MRDHPSRVKSQFERFVRQANLILSQTAWLNGRRTRQKLSALPQPTDELRTPKVFASKEHSRSATLQHTSEAIERLDVREQIRLLEDLPAHLKIQPDDVAWLKAAEPAFKFWNNPEDAIYDQL